MDKEYVEKNIIFDTVVGSQAYGTNDENSDVDTAGIMIPGLEYFFGTDRFEQFREYETDRVVYSLKKVVGLAADNNPNILDLLCSPERCIIKNTKYWQVFMENKHLFISKACKATYLGYATAQLHRITTHRKYLLQPPLTKPERKDFGLKETPVFETSHLKSILNAQSVFNYVLPEKIESFIHELDEVYAENVLSVFKKYLNPDRRAVCLKFIQGTLKSQLNTFVCLGQIGFLKDEYFEEAEKEIKYANALVEYKNYQEWKEHRNKKRAELEVKFGYDTKNAMHLVRLVNMGKEILSTGKVNTDRTTIDAEELKAIKKGAWSFERVENYASEAENEMKGLYKNSTLQETAQYDKINEILVKTIEEYHDIHSK